MYDYIGYQYRSFDLVDSLQNDFVGALNYIKYTIANLDYNLFPILFLIPFLKIFGKTRMIYIGSNVLLYLIPAMILLLIIILRQHNKKIYIIKENILLIVTIFISIFCFTGFWSATLRGLPDIIGIIPIYCLMLLITIYDFTKKEKFLVPILFGFLTYVPFLCRRWYAYSVVAIYIAYFLVCLIKFLKSENKKEVFKNCFINFTIAATVCVSLLVLLQKPLVKNILSSSYGDIYSAYQVEFMQHVNNIIGEYGWIIIVLAIFGVILGIKKEEFYDKILFSIFEIIIFVILFTRVQGMGVHHFLGISPFVIYLAINGYVFIYEKITKNITQKIFLIMILIFFCLNFSTTYIFRNLNIPILTQKHKYNKLRYENYENLLSFTTDLSDTIKKEYGKLSSFASSDIMADSLLDVVGDDVIKSNLWYSSAIDLRDGLNFNSLLYKYVVVTDIPQAGSNPDKQQTVIYPNNLIINKEGIGKSYKKILGPYLLSNNVNVFLYEKDRKFEEEDINCYLNYFYNLYPEWKSDYYLVDKMILASDIEFGDGLGDVKKIDERTYFLFPGYTPTRIKAVLGDIEKLNLEFYVDKNIPENEKYGVVVLKIKQDEKVIFDGNINRSQNANIDIDRKLGNNIEFEISYGEDFCYDYLYMKINSIN